MEKLRKATMADMRAGAILVQTPCYWCSRSHRFMVLRVAGASTWYRADGSLVNGAGTLVYAAPGRNCGAPPGGVVVDDSVRDGRMFVVEDGLESNEATVKQKKTLARKHHIA